MWHFLLQKGDRLILLAQLAIAGVICWSLFTVYSKSATPLQQGIDAQENGDYDKAIADYTQAIELDPKNEKIYETLGHVYLDREDYFLAIACYSEALRLDQNNADVYLDRGDAYKGKGDDDHAISDYSQAIRLYLQSIKLNPKPALYSFSCCTALNNRGLAYDDKGDYDDAIADYNQAIQINPKEDYYYQNRGDAYDDKGVYDKAIADYTQAIQLSPKTPFFYNYNALAWLLATCPQADLRDGKKAVEYATKACELTEWKTPITLDTLAAAYAEVGDFDKAVKWENQYLATPNLIASKTADAQSRLALYQSHQPYHTGK